MVASAIAIALTVSVAPTPQEAPTKDSARKRGHGPSAPSNAFAHVFQLRAHTPDRPQLAFHYGLLQPLASRGFNAAVDVRYKRFVATYSHGQGLEIDRFPGTLSDAETEAGVEAFMPWTTGFGAGAVLIDELYLLADFKVHGFEIRYEGDTSRYTTITLGLELGWRLFLWKGLHVTPVIRYWPTIYSSLPDRTLQLDETSGLRHESIPQGLRGVFANVLLGWAFGL